MEFNTSITLTILEEDIRELNYHDSENCPITKALARAGYPELRESGGSLTNNGDTEDEFMSYQTDETFYGLSGIVLDMEHYINTINDGWPIPEGSPHHKEPKTFDFTFKVKL